MDSLTNADYQLIDILTSLNDEGIISDTVTSMEVELITNIKYKVKEKYVLQRHINLDGSKAKIHPPKNEGGLWYTVNPLDRGKKIRGSSKQVLIEKLFRIYSANDNNIIDTSFSGLFEYGLSKRAILRKLAPSTLDRYRSTFKTYFESIKDKEVIFFNKNDIAKFITKIVTEFRPSDKEIKQIFGIFNLIYEYASEGPTKIMDYNPMDGVELISYLKGDYASVNSASVEYGKTEKVFSQDEVIRIQNEAKNRINTKTYYPHPYMILFASITGARTGEICSLMWDDLKEYGINFHTQMVDDRVHQGKDKWCLLNWTKDEKGISKGGRLFPYIDGVEELLVDLKKRQTQLNIKSKYVFCKSDGSFTTPEDYRGSLLKLCKKLGLSVTNNHAFRKAANQRLTDEGYRLAERSNMLGHSPEVNQKNYTVADNDFIINATSNYRSKNNIEQTDDTPIPTVNKDDIKVIDFATRKRALRASI